MSAEHNSSSRFSPVRREVCGLLPYDRPTPRLGREDSLNRHRTAGLIGVNSHAIYDHEGNIGRVKDVMGGQVLDFGDRTMLFSYIQPGADGSIEYRFEPEALDTIEGAWIQPISPWGEMSVMSINFGGKDGVPPAFVDLPRHILERVVHHEARVLEKLQKDGRPVMWGENNSFGLDGEGLRTLFDPHQQMFRFSEVNKDLSADEIQDSRSRQLWDEGVSHITGESVVEVINDAVLPYYRNGHAQADAMGYVISLPGYRPADMGNIEFIDKLWRPLSHINHSALKQAHAEVFESDLDDIIHFVEGLRGKGYIDTSDRQRYSQYFDPTPQHAGESYRRVKLRELQQNGELRQPAGWTGGIYFTDEGGLVVVTFGFLKRSTGPVESAMVGLERPQAPIPVEEMTRKKQEAVTVFEYSFAA
ncbi:MAG: hypothetical protein HYT10_00075 [Candidatus Levybacteria bacterium]|nr:hypothetical protein [Candidatus Levybacteria bacterium]